MQKSSIAAVELDQGKLRNILSSMQGDEKGAAQPGPKSPPKHLEEITITEEEIDRLRKEAIK